MRIVIMIGAATLVFVGHLVSAEARGGGGLAGVRGAVLSRGTVVPPRLRLSPDAILSGGISHRAGTGPRYTALPGPEPITRGIPLLAVDAPATATAPVAPVQKAAASPWCPPERLVGSGKGFCLIN